MTNTIEQMITQLLEPKLSGALDSKVDGDGVAVFVAVIVAFSVADRSGANPTLPPSKL